ncbi:cutinase [Mycolicibacterium mageritense DSM 44476 = CIP 104973]|nr:cutinase [Mycolicibacterium mageritense DSM 44476 = CIP 104973]
MAKNARRKRHRILALIAAGAMTLVVVLVVAIVVIIMRRPETPSAPPSAQPPAGQPGGVPSTGKPRPEFQSADCPDVQLLSIPGTWESSVRQDPFNPTEFPLALLLNVTNPLRAQFDNSRLEIYTVPTPRSSTIRSPPTSRCRTTTAARKGNVLRCRR